MYIPDSTIIPSMCGRFALSKSREELQSEFPDIDVPAQYAPRYNIAPSQPVAAIANIKGVATLTHFLWGLVPSWSKGPNSKYSMINARAETITEKPSFKNAFKRRRCLIPTNGFYEWQRIGKQKQPMFIGLNSERCFTMGGIWETWTGEGGEQLNSVAIVTTAPNELMAPIHNRMPVIVAPRDRDTWLFSNEMQLPGVFPLLGPYPAAAMQARPVSTYVNSPFNEGPMCLE